MRNFPFSSLIFASYAGRFNADIGISVCLIADNPGTKVTKFFFFANSLPALYCLFSLFTDIASVCFL